PLAIRRQQRDQLLPCCLGELASPKHNTSPGPLVGTQGLSYLPAIHRTRPKLMVCRGCASSTAAAVEAHPVSDHVLGVLLALGWPLPGDAVHQLVDAAGKLA